MSYPVVGADLGSNYMKLAGTTSSVAHISRWEDNQGVKEMPLEFNTETKLTRKFAKNEKKEYVVGDIMYAINPTSALTNELRKNEYVNPEVTQAQAHEALVEFLSNINKISETKTLRVPERVVITTSSHFRSEQHELILRAAREAKINRPMVYTDATAAAYYYAKTEELRNETFLFVNVGQTLGATVVEMKNGREFNILESHVYPIFVGKMLDDLIFKYAISNFVKANKNRTGDITLKKIEELKERCVEAKQRLIYSEKTDITVYNFQGETELNVRIDRGSLENEADDIVTMVIELLEKFDAGQIKKVILSGLTSKQQFIKDIVSSMFDEKNIYYEEFGEVALGAAYIAKDGGVEENDSGSKEIIAPVSSEDLGYHRIAALTLSVLSSGLVFA